MPNAALWALPLARGLDLLGGRGVGTHHLTTGGVAESLMAETEGKRQRRESGQPGLYPIAQPLRLWGGEVPAAVPVSCP